MNLATQLHAEHTSPEHAASGFKLPDTVPNTAAERKALAAQLKPIVDELKTRMELREDIRRPCRTVRGLLQQGAKADSQEALGEERNALVTPACREGRRQGFSDRRTASPSDANICRSWSTFQKILEGNKEAWPQGTRTSARTRSFIHCVTTPRASILSPYGPQQ